MGGEDDHDQEDQPALVVEEVADEPAEVQHGWVCATGRGGSGRRGYTVSTTGTPEAGPGPYTGAGSVDTTVRYRVDSIERGRIVGAGSISVCRCRHSGV